MDPWQSLESNEQSNESWFNDNAKVESPGDKLEFEDNFEPPKSDKLPDSEEYLALLEAKLEKIRSDPNFLRQLAQKREDCMQALLNSDSVDEILDLDTPIENSTILRTILPQRQALTQGELVELVHYDQLIEENDINSQNIENSHSR